jgi:FlaA1/EpsC-like NDP-sugar epimerase
MNKNDSVKILIIGAGKAGELIAKSILNATDSSFEIVGFIDDNLNLQGKKVENFEVLGSTADVKKIILEHEVEELLIALPSERGEVIRRIINNTEGCKVTYKILPRDSEVLFQNYEEDYLKHIRRVAPEDLLGGVINKSDQKSIAKSIVNEVIMITGAAGSIGSELSRQIALYGAKKVVFYDWWENGVFDLRNQVLEINPDGRYEFVIGDMKDRKRINAVMKEFKPSSVFHAGAYKHVPLMEDNPAEAIKNNIFGTKIVAEAAIRNGVKKFVLVSSDKAVNPTNVMGATKRGAEKVINILSESQNTTTFCAVRFGNVINSNGSVIPFFNKQIEKGGPVTVTHKEVTRFFMTIPEACTLILKAWIMGENNDLFVLDMGEPIKIYDLAKTLIILNGYIPEEEIKINIIGLRPGEKLYEEVLVGEEETNATSVDKIFRTQNYMDYDKLAFMHGLEMLEEEVNDGLSDIDEIKQRLQELVPSFDPAKH